MKFAMLFRCCQKRRRYVTTMIAVFSHVILQVLMTMASTGNSSISRGNSTSFSTTVDDFCLMDSGRNSFTDHYGITHSIYVSRTRDGSVWVRVGQDHSTMDWTLVDEHRLKLQTSILDDDTIALLQQLPTPPSGAEGSMAQGPLGELRGAGERIGSGKGEGLGRNFCVLTDAELIMNVEASWNPSFLLVYDPMERNTKIVSLRKLANRDCATHTNISLTGDKQTLRCEGSRATVCGQKNLPERGQSSPHTLFLKYVNIDTHGPDNWYCSGGVEMRSSFSFVSSFYHAFHRVAICDPPTDSSTLGHAAILRRHVDVTSGLVLLPDPTQTALSPGLINGWQLYAKVVSISHYVFLQIWRRRSRDVPPASRPSGYNKPLSPMTGGDTLALTSYILVGQTFFRPSQLRYQEIHLAADEFIRVERGDLIGLYFSDSNPVGWSSVPCGGDARQAYRYHVVNYGAASLQNLTVGTTLSFATTSLSDQHACRHYSIVALFANKTNVLSVEDWTCPSSSPSLSRPPPVSSANAAISHPGDFSSAGVDHSSTAYLSRSGSRPGDQQEDGEDRPPGYIRDSAAETAPSVKESSSSKGAKVGGDGRGSTALGAQLHDKGSIGEEGVEASLPVHVLLLIVLGTLLALMIVVGIVSYYKAVSS